jgi:hypothetical protein
MMPVIYDLVPAIVSYVREQGGCITKTKLIKLLYLFDVEFYRVHRKTFTGFDWIFFHLGPWTKEYDTVLQQLLSKDILDEVPSSKPDIDAKFYRSLEPRDLNSVLPDYRDRSILRFVLDNWGNRPTGEILDYVYFRTEPMEHAVRNQPLDFSSIRIETPPRYRRQPSGKTPHQIEALRKQWRLKSAGPCTEKAMQDSYTPPRYDEEFFDALLKLDQAKT